MVPNKRRTLVSDHVSKIVTVGDHCPGKYLASPSFGVTAVTNSLPHTRYSTCIIIFGLEESSVSWCYFIHVRACVLSQFCCIWLFATLWTVAHRLLCPWDSPGKSTGVGRHFLLHGIFPTQGSNPCLLHLLHWQMGSLPLAPPGKHFIQIFGALVFILAWIIPTDRGAWWATVHGVLKSQTRLSN